MLTNFAADTFAEAKELFLFLKVPRGVSVSGENRNYQARPGIYEAHVKSFDLAPEACRFIDDSKKNVDGAIAAGWQAMLFTGTDKLRENLPSFAVM